MRTVRLLLALLVLGGLPTAGQPTALLAQMPEALPAPPADGVVAQEQAGGEPSNAPAPYIASIVDSHRRAIPIRGGEASVTTGDRFFVDIEGAVPGEQLTVWLSGQRHLQAVADAEGRVRGLEIRPPRPGHAYLLEVEPQHQRGPEHRWGTLFVRFRRPTRTRPVIDAVHACDQPPEAVSEYPGIPSADCPMLIRQRRFQIRVRDQLNPLARYDLIAYFNGEEIGRETDVSGTDLLPDDTYLLTTRKGFPPGRYLLTVRIVGTTVAYAPPASHPVRVDYQPTLLHRMGCGAGADATEDRCPPKPVSPSDVPVQASGQAQSADAAPHESPEHAASAPPGRPMPAPADTEELPQGSATPQDAFAEADASPGRLDLAPPGR